MPKKKSKLRVQTEVALWGFYFWWKSFWSNRLEKLPSSEGLYEDYLKRLKEQEQRPNWSSFEAPDIRRYNLGEYWFRMVLYPMVSTVSVVGIIFFLFLVADAFASFVQGPEDPLTAPIHLVEAPSAVVIEATGESQLPWWDTAIDSWLTSQESVALREETNVVNFVLLHADEVRYATYQSFKFDDQWEQRRPYFVDAVAVEGTAVVIEIAGQQFNLNVYQPFTWKSSPDTIVMVDDQGTLWTVAAGEVLPMTGFELPVVINANPDLEIGFIKH